jgi:type I restriction-modification system DNA methylase subunit
VTSHLTLPQLASYLWGAAVVLRGLIGAGAYKQFIFPLVFCSLSEKDLGTK